MIRVAGPVFPYPEAVRQQVIEAGIHPLVDALYRVGAEPLASCAGHGFWCGVLYAEPYVFFKAPEWLVARLLCAIWENVPTRRLYRELLWRWDLAALPDDDGSAKWTLRARPRWYSWPTRRALARDVSLLVRLLEQEGGHPGVDVKPTFVPSV